MLIGTASAGTLYRNVSSATGHPGVVAGEVNSDGSIALGKGFTVQHLGPGQYEVTFDRRYFRSGCAVMTVTPVGSTYYNPFPEVNPGPCNRVFTVYMQVADTNKTSDWAFMFIARETE